MPQKHLFASCWFIYQCPTPICSVMALLQAILLISVAPLGGSYRVGIAAHISRKRKASNSEFMEIFGKIGNSWPEDPRNRLPTLACPACQDLPSHQPAHQPHVQLSFLGAPTLCSCHGPHSIPPWNVLHLAVGFQLLWSRGRRWSGEHSIQNHLTGQMASGELLFSHLLNGSDTGNLRGCVGISSVVCKAWHPVGAWEWERGWSSFWDDFPAPLHIGTSSTCWVLGAMDSGCLVWRQPGCVPATPFPPREWNPAGMHVAFFPGYLGHLHRLAGLRGHMGLVSYVPTHACSHIYAPFSKGESDPWLELQMGEESPTQVRKSLRVFLSSFSNLPPSLCGPVLPACCSGHLWPV